MGDIEKYLTFSYYPHGSICLLFGDEVLDAPIELTPGKFKKIVADQWCVSELRQHAHLREEVLEGLARWRRAIEELEATINSYG